MGEMVTKPGFYDGKFRKSGQRHSGPESTDIAMKNAAAAEKEKTLPPADKKEAVRSEPVKVEHRK